MRLILSPRDVLCLALCVHEMQMGRAERGAGQSGTHAKAPAGCQLCGARSRSPPSSIRGSRAAYDGMVMSVHACVYVCVWRAAMQCGEEEGRKGQ